jgi:hypothetical protein
MRADYSRKQFSKKQKKKGKWFFVRKSKIERMEALHIVLEEIEELQRKREQKGQVVCFREVKDIMKEKRPYDSQDYAGLLMLEKSIYNNNQNKYLVDLFQSMVDREENRLIQMSAQNEYQITSGYVEDFEDSFENRDEKAIKDIMGSRNREQILYSVAVMFHEEGTENECAGLINYSSDNNYVEYALQELANKVGIPVYCMLEQAEKEVQKVA